MRSPSARSSAARHYLEMYPGFGGWLLALACTGVVFVAGAKLLDSVSGCLFVIDPDRPDAFRFRITAFTSQRLTPLQTTVPTP
jgi:hypothetical protein